MLFLGPPGRVHVCAVAQIPEIFRLLLQHLYPLRWIDQLEDHEPRDDKGADLDGCRQHDREYLAIKDAKK